MGLAGRAALSLGCGILFSVLSTPVMAATGFRFDRDTLSFTNSTVFEYHEGVARLRKSGAEKEPTPRYTRRCFVMCRTAVQFTKFARFDPRGARLNDKELAERVRQLTRHAVWKPALPVSERVVFPGYKNLRQLSHERGWVLQKNIGLGWPTYARIGNYRMFYNHSTKYQIRTHEQLNEALGRGELFVAYLSDFPTLHINHAVLVYGRKPASSKNKGDRYNCYDPNHPDGPRELVWLPDKQEFNFEKDQEFVGGFARVFRVYSKPLQ
ncbi:MAG TPA: hypothetical protein VGM62_18850 [Chthoniobacterales bacterium]|jgi:hypothetical protein